LWRTFWPVSLITRSRFAAGLKSTPKFWPTSGTLSCETSVAEPELPLVSTISARRPELDSVSLSGGFDAQGTVFVAPGN
jgi:hypothetical protein